MTWYEWAGIIALFALPFIILIWGINLPQKSDADKSNPYSDLNADG